MTFVGWLQISVVLALVVGLAYPMGSFIVELFEGRRTFLSPVLAPVERAVYRLAGVDPAVEQKWLAYTAQHVGLRRRLLRPALRNARNDDLGSALASGLALASGFGFRLRRGFDGIENPIREQFHAVVHEEPGQSIGPDESCPSPAEGSHEQPIDRDQGRQRLGAEHGRP